MKNNLFSNLKGDAFGGITAGIVGLPLALAFGVTSGLGAVAGLYGAIILGILAPIFGGTKTQISAPTGPMTVVAAVIIGVAINAEGGLAANYGLVVTTFLLAGIIQVVFGFLKLGRYVHYIPYPVVSGFMSGIGVIIILMQFNDFFGVDVKYGVIETITHATETVSRANFISIALASSTILIIFLFPYITKAVPSTLIALVVVSGVAYFAGLDVRVVGDIPTKLPELRIGSIFQFDMDKLGTVLFASFSLGALGMIDSLLTSVVADKLTRTKHKSNQELIGQGIGNIGVSLVGGLVGAGTTVCTVTNIKSGAKTPVSGVIQGLFLAFVLIAGASVAAKIPFAVLAGILITIGIKIIDTNTLKSCGQYPKSDNFIMFTVLILTVFWSLLYAVAIGLVLAAIFFMKKMGDVIELYSKRNDNKTEGVVQRLIENVNDPEQFRQDVFIKSLKGPIFFGFANRFEESIKSLKGIKAVVFNMESVPYVDQSGLMTFEDALRSLKNRNIKIYLAEVNKDITKLFRGVDLIPDIVEDEHVFYSLEQCMMYIFGELGYYDKMHHHRLVIPPVFTPNGDGFNDHWEIRHIDEYPESKVRIWDKEGETIFESIGYKEPFSGKFNGKNVPAGDYFYRIDLNDGSDPVRGTVSLIR